MEYRNTLSDPIPAEIGMMQGGLTSTFMFTIFYQDLINYLDNTPGGLKINNNSYCVLSYADDKILACNTATELQIHLKLIVVLKEKVHLKRTQFEQLMELYYQPKVKSVILALFSVTSRETATVLVGLGHVEGPFTVSKVLVSAKRD